MLYKGITTHSYSPLPRAQGPISLGNYIIRACFYSPKFSVVILSKMAQAAGYLPCQQEPKYHNIINNILTIKQNPSNQLSNINLYLINLIIIY